MSDISNEIDLSGLQQSLDEIDYANHLENTISQLMSKINELKTENERLKDELKQTEVQDQVVFDNLRKENSKLKCLALHSMREYFKAMSALNTWNEEYYGEAKYLHRAIRYDKRTKQYDNAYRKAMLALMEGK